MPQAVRVNHTMPRRKVEQFQTHGENNPSHNKTWPSSPRPLQLLVSGDTEPTPKQVLDDSYNNVGRHVIRVIETPEREVGDVRHVKRDAQHSPDSSDAVIHRGLQIPPEYPDRGVVEPVHDARSSAKVIQLFRDAEISRVKDHAEDPARETKVSKQQIVLSQSVGCRDVLSNLRHAVIMRKEIHEGEDDGEWLLHAHEAVKRPFAVELEDGFSVWRIACQARVGYYMLTGVVAFRWAVPE